MAWRCSSALIGGAAGEGAGGGGAGAGAGAADEGDAGGGEAGRAACREVSSPSRGRETMTAGRQEENVRGWLITPPSADREPLRVSTRGLLGCNARGRVRGGVDG